MKFGLLSQIQVPKPWAEDTERNVYWQNLDHVVAAEHAGFSHFWLTEQHFFAEIGHCASPEMFLAALSQRTRTIRLGFAVILMPCHNPFMIAERVATLDVLSNGRCEFGAGRGTAAYVVEGLGFNADAEYGREVGREALEAVVQMLEQEHFPGYKGEHFDLPARQVVPRPIQRPHPPLWFAASNLETFERAGAAGVGVLGVTRYTHAEIKPHVAAYRAAIRNATPIGRFVNNHVGVFAIGCVHDDDRIGRDIGCAAARFYYGDNDAELNHVRFGSSEGVARIKARMAGYSERRPAGERHGDRRQCRHRVPPGGALGGDRDRPDDLHVPDRPHHARSDHALDRDRRGEGDPAVCRLTERSTSFLSSS